MGPEPFTGLASKGCDLYICYDYRSLALPDLTWMEEYEQVELLAWSMGVFVAAATLADRCDKFTSATALAGTLYPIDDRRGIPVAAYEEMERSLTQDELDRFHASMFDAPEKLQRLVLNRPKRTPVSVREELICLHKHIRAAETTPRDIFSHRIVTTRDRIFPARNQMRAWGKDRCEQHKWPHFPFYSEQFW
jgi:biotin synthesis protein BioG